MNGKKIKPMENKRKKLKAYPLYILFFILALIPLILFYYNSCGGNKHANISSTGNNDGNGNNGGGGTTGTILSAAERFDVRGADTSSGGSGIPIIDFLFIVETSAATRRTKYIGGDTPKFNDSNFLSISRQNINSEIQVLRFGDLAHGVSNNGRFYAFSGGYYAQDTNTRTPSREQLTEAFIHLSSYGRTFAPVRTVPTVSLPEIIYRERTNITFRGDASSLAIILISAIDDKPPTPNTNNTSLIEALYPILSRGGSNLTYKFHSIVTKVKEGTENTPSCDTTNADIGHQFMEYSADTTGTVIDICSGPADYTSGFNQILRAHGATPVVINTDGSGGGNDQTVPVTTVVLQNTPIHNIITGINKIDTTAQGETKTPVTGRTINLSGKTVTISTALDIGKYEITYSYRGATSPPTTPAN